MTLGTAEVGDLVAQFWTLAQRARLSMRFNVEPEALPGLIEDLKELAYESPVAGIQQGAASVVADYLRRRVAELTPMSLGDSA